MVFDGDGDVNLVATVLEIDAGAVSGRSTEIEAPPPAATRRIQHRALGDRSYRRELTITSGT